MHGTYLIEVARKSGIKDPLAAEITEDIKHVAGRAAGSCKVTTAKLYRLIGHLSPDERARVKAGLLSDPVVEEAHEGGWAPKETSSGRKLSPAKSVVIDVWFKQGVTDAVGESVLKGLRDMDLEKIEDVRTGMRYRFTGLKDPKTADKLALALLFNPLIQERTLHVD
jgi:phosphoribosylformylglycinamidine (FGAM) synthase PurS component